MAEFQLLKKSVLDLLFTSISFYKIIKSINWMGYKRWWDCNKLYKRELIFAEVVVYFSNFIRFSTCFLILNLKGLIFAKESLAREFYSTPQKSVLFIIQLWVFNRVFLSLSTENLTTKSYILFITTASFNIRVNLFKMFRVT